MIDEELDRLSEIRAILLPLLTSPSLPNFKIVIPPAAVQEPVTPSIKQLPPREAPARRSRKPKPAPATVTALNGVVPSKPVVFQPATKPTTVITTPSFEVQRSSFAAMVRDAEQAPSPQS